MTSTDLGALSEEELYELVAETDDPDVLAAIATALHSALPWAPQDYQRPPPGGWWTWIFQGGRGSGKMLDVTTAIPTPDGWSKLGDLAVGDAVFDEAGRPCRITGVFDGTPERAWRLWFSDGTYLDACDEHQWVTWTHAERKAYLRCSAEPDRYRFPEDWPTWRAARRAGGIRYDQATAEAAVALVRGGASYRDAERATGIGRKLIARWDRDRWSLPPALVWPDAPGPQVRTTAEIVSTLNHGDRGDTNHAIPTCAPLRLPDARLPIDPYVLGYWLGDGSSRAGSFTCHIDDQPGLIAELDRAGYRPHLTPRHDGKTIATYGLTMDLRAAGVLGAKHVPAVYLRGSVEQREAILAGLLDSDGYAGGGAIEFCNTSRALADAVLDLARSLGQKPVLAVGRATLYGVDHGPKYRVTWRPTRQPFRLARKAADCPLPAGQSLRSHYRMIVRAEPVAPVPMRCLSVDSPNRMYLAGEAYVPTHNTDTGAWWFDEHMNGPPCDPRLTGGHKGVLVGPTHGDSIASQVKGATGLMAHNKDVRLVNRKDGTFVRWPNGAEAVVLGMHSENDAERLRANAANCCCWWIDEAAIGNHLKVAIDNLRFGARLPMGRPHGIATTTPKPTAQYREFTRMPGVEVTKASSYSNRYLTDEHRDVIAIYEGTRLGAQEIHGELIDAYEGALWNLDTLNADRVSDESILSLPPADRLAALGIVKVGTGIDPSTWIPEIGAPPEDDYQSGAGVETGLVTVGVDRRNPPHVYVFADSSGRVAAVEWARRATNDYHLWRAAWLVPETNAGGDMVLATIHLTDPTVAIYREPDSKKPGVRAAVGKRARAEPVALLSDQHRFHLVGSFPALEATLTGWDPTLSWSPDRLDALVWPVTALKPWRKRGTSGVGGRGLARAR